jgi:Zn-dependent peptidase ImmA (M78 family)
MKQDNEQFEDEQGSPLLRALRQLALKLEGDPINDDDENTVPTPSELKAIASKQAQHLLRALSPQPPVDVLNLITAFPSWNVLSEVRMPASGMTNWNSTKGSWITLINATEPLTRQRFSVLHELKHVIDHPQRKSLQQVLSPQSIEELCDEFAALVLMPEVFVRSHWSEHADVQSLANACEVSIEAMHVRLGVLGLTSPPERSLVFARPIPGSYLRTKSQQIHEATMLDASGQGQRLETLRRKTQERQRNPAHRPISLSLYASRMRDLSMQGLGVS